MKKWNALVVYDSVHGSTVEIAEYIGRKLAGSDFEVDVKHISKPLVIAGYDALVIGSPIVMGHWTNETMSFIEDNLVFLEAHPLALFITCLAHLWGIADRTTIEERYVKPVLQKYPNLHPVSIGVFSGVLDYPAYNERTRQEMQQVISRFKGPIAGRHDYRNWNEINQWSQLVVEQMKRTGAHS